MKSSFLIIVFFILSLPVLSQVPDTVYVDEVDTVVVKQEPVVVNKTFYKPVKSPVSEKKRISISLGAGLLTDLNYYKVCESCGENFSTLQSSSKNSRNLQAGLMVNYYLKRWSFGMEIQYRASIKPIRYQNETLDIDNKIKVNYLMLGPVISYKILNLKRWDIDLYGAVDFSFTTRQSGTTIAGESIREETDLSVTPVYAKRNILYHLSPALTYKLSPVLGVSLSGHYYFDHYSNVKSQPYTEYRNTLGLILGIRWML